MKHNQTGVIFGVTTTQECVMSFTHAIQNNIKFERLYTLYLGRI